MNLMSTASFHGEVVECSKITRSEYSAGKQFIGNRRQYHDWLWKRHPQKVITSEEDLETHDYIKNNTIWAQEHFVVRNTDQFRMTASQPFWDWECTHMVNITLAQCQHVSIVIQYV